MVDDLDTAAAKRHEARLRRLAARMGLALCKSRARDPNRMDFGCYRIIDARTRRPVAGTYPYAHSLTLERVEEALGDLLENPIEEAQMRRGLPGHGCASGALDPKWEQ